MDGLICWVMSITINQINLDYIEIIQFFLKFYDLLRYPHLLVGVLVDGCFDGWGHVKSLKIKYNLT